MRETFSLVAKACSKHDVKFEQDNPICSVVPTNAFPGESVYCPSMSFLGRNMSILEITEIIFINRNYSVEELWKNREMGNRQLVERVLLK